MKSVYKLLWSFWDLMKDWKKYHLPLFLRIRVTMVMTHWSHPECGQWYIIVNTYPSSSPSHQDLIFSWGIPSQWQVPPSTHCQGWRLRAISAHSPLNITPQAQPVLSFLHLYNHRPGPDYQILSSDSFCNFPMDLSASRLNILSPAPI